VHTVQHHVTHVLPRVVPVPAGFWWQLLFNVEKTPTLPDAAPEVAAAAASTVVEFVGVRCHVNCGAHDYWPRVVRFKASIAALQVGCWVNALRSCNLRAIYQLLAGLRLLGQQRHERRASL
jgi:hypothetical protein